MLEVSRLRKPLLPLAVLAALLPVMLVLSAWRTYTELDAQRLVYLRSRAAAVAARMESLADSSDWRERLAGTEDGLMEARVFDRSGSPPALDAIWEGRELFRTESLPGGRFRAWIPFHLPSGEVRLARIDLNEHSADFLVEHATHHLWFAGLGAILIFVLAWLTGRSVQAASNAEHLARLGQMSAVLAHEIRNPLGTIKGFAQLLREKAAGQDAALIDPIVSETERLENLVKDLLAYGRPAKPMFRQADARALVSRLMRPGGRVKVEVPEIVLDTDAAMLEQALLNLVNNGLEASQGQVRVAVRPDGGHVLFQVTDDGPGLTEEAQRRMFEGFYTSKASGTGLGLSITKRLTESLGGTLSINNREEGGVCAQIRLPLRRKA